MSVCVRVYLCDCRWIESLLWAVFLRVVFLSSVRVHSVLESGLLVCLWPHHSKRSTCLSLSGALVNR